MKGKAALLAGLSIGYVLGTRDGRERYEQIKAQANKAWQNPRVQKTANDAQAKAQEVAKQAADVAQDKVQDKMPDKMKSKSGNTTETPLTSTPAPTSPAPDTVGTASSSSPTPGQS